MITSNRQTKRTNEEREADPNIYYIIGPFRANDQKDPSVSKNVPAYHMAGLSELKLSASKFSPPEHRVDPPEPMFGSSKPLEWLTRLNLKSSGPTTAIDGQT